MRQSMPYYSRGSLEAVRVGKWKLHFRKGESIINELYNLEEDMGEKNNCYDRYPDVVERLRSFAGKCIKDLGDAASGIPGENVREIGRVPNPKMLTTYDPNHPYIIALYDKTETG